MTNCKNLSYCDICKEAELKAIKYKYYKFLGGE